MLAKKQARRERALKRLENQLASGVIIQKLGVERDPVKYMERIKKEIQTLKDRLEGKKKTKVTKEGTTEPLQKDKWWIDIYHINMGYVKNSIRRKKENKGKSKKKMKKQKSVTFVKSIVAQPGMIQNFKEGRMGISPKSHTFRLRKDEVDFFN